MRSYAGAKAFSVPCGKCMGCRVSRAQEWQTRLVHEAKSHNATGFLTLTFSDDHLPDNYSVSTRDLQLFLKRYRKFLGHSGLRYFACGEYGEQNWRPHYHLAVFGHSFSDLVPWRRTKSGHVTYRSQELERLWPYGHCEIGTLTPQSAGYIAKYITKKVTGERAAEHYRRVHPLTGEICQLTPEFLVMSKGIGATWFDRYAMDAFPSDFVIVDGQKRPVPRYYTKKLAEREAARIKSKRKEKAAKHADNNVDSRLLVREESLSLKTSRFARDLGEDT